MNNDNEEWIVKSKKWKDTRTGEIVTQFSILDIGYMEEYNGD